MWYWKEKRQHAIGFLDLTISARCTLNCRDCMQFIPYQPKQDVPLESLKQELESLFYHILFVGEISVIGGEPFLYSKMAELLEYIDKNYRERIGSIVITTNGTIVPNPQTLSLCCDAGVFISISDYSNTIPELADRIEKVETAAHEADVKIERKRWNWTDPGRFDADTDFVGCTQTHMQIADGKLWSCTLMAAGYTAGFCTAVDGHDYFNLLHRNQDIGAFLNKESTERTSLCRRCMFPRGVSVPSAVQN